MKLFALMLCPLGFTTGAFVFAGVLEPMAETLGVSIATAATLQSAFAIACAISGPVLAHLARALPAKPTLVGVLVALTLLNAASALAVEFRDLFVLRLVAGGIGSLSLPLATALATVNVAPNDRGKVVSTVYAGIPMALILGIPLGSLAGNSLSWPASFVVAAGLCFLATICVLAFVPGTDQGKRDFGAAQASLLDGKVLAHFGITFLASMALFSLVGLIGPVIRATTGASGNGIAFLQFLAGLSSLAGVRIGAKLVGIKERNALLVPFGLLTVSLALVMAPLAVGTTTVFSIGAMTLSVLFGPAAQSTTGVLVQTRMAAIAGPNATLAFALNGSMLYLGQGFGIALGAAASANWGLVAAPVVGLLLTVPGAALATFIIRNDTSLPIPKDA